MPRVYRSFATRPEAEAFQAGVEFVNDPSVTVVEIIEPAVPDRPFLVELEDRDQDADQDPDNA